MSKPTATAAAPTTAQKARRAARTNGRYDRNKCERCGKGAPMDYFSDHRCDQHGFGVILCKRCADKLGDMTDEEFAAEAALHAK